MSDHDCIVLGGGVGGMCSAALLSHSGLKVLLLERKPYLGGRFSTVERKGFRCAVGGLAVPIGHNMEQVCDTIGIPSGVIPSKDTAVWLDGELFDLKNGGTRRIIHEISTPDETKRVITALGGAMKGDQPAENLNFRDWLTQYTSNPKIHGLFQATISSLLTVNSDELPAREYFEIIRVLAPLTFGYIEGGSLTLWNRMAAYIEENGGTILTSARVDEICVSDDRMTAVRFGHKRQDQIVETPIAISNLGPKLTVDLIDSAMVSPSYAQSVDTNMTPTALIWLHFSSPERLFEHSALSVGCTKRVNMIDAPSYEAADLAPAGQHLYTVGAAPSCATAPKDIEQDYQAVMDDLERIIPDFEKRCTILSRTCYRDQWPGFRTVPGKNMGHETPISGLYNVGDAACPSGYACSMCAAKSAQLVTDAILGIQRR
jgi:phytoene desaturase